MLTMKPSLLIAVLVGADASVLRFRRTSEKIIAGSYEPISDVSDHLRIDLDQKAIEQFVGLGTSNAFSNAQAVYEKGGHSKSVASINLGSPLGLTAKAGTQVLGKNAAGEEVVLKVYKDVAGTEDSIQLQYISEPCFVGGLQPADADADGDNQRHMRLDMCLSENGTITVDGSSPVDYTYTVDTDNTNGRTIAGFSRQADTRNRPQDDTTKPYFKFFQMFVDYYGSSNYADEMVMAAFGKKQTSFSNGNADFSRYADNADALGESVKKTTSNMNIRMYVIRELEDAISDCSAQCGTTACNNDQVNALDEAVAFYTGSTQDTGSNNLGVLTFALADKRAVNFRTAGERGGGVEGRSQINHEVFKHFNRMKKELVDRECSKAAETKDKIVADTIVPLIQGTLRYAYISQTDAFDLGAEAEGAIFAASVLPHVATCSADDAAIIYDSMKVGQNGDANFAAVKSAFERNYGCMGVTCEKVGGIWDDSTNSYSPGAAPCTSSGSSVNVGLAVGLSIAAVVAVLLVFLYCKYRSKSRDVEFKGGDSPVA